MKRLLWILILALSGMVHPLVNAANEEFPFRVRYPDVSVMSTEELSKRFNEVLVIDVRSKYEFDTLHVKDAVNVPLTTGFGEKMVRLRAQHNKPLVFYCNGKTCLKSYDAALSAAKARLHNLYAYDSGIFDWAKARPELTVLLGRTPVRPENLIDESKFKARLIEPKRGAGCARSSAARHRALPAQGAARATRRDEEDRRRDRGCQGAEKNPAGVRPDR
jgi:rhodanese-related sulfurtransferase